MSAIHVRWYVMSAVHVPPLGRNPNQLSPSVHERKKFLFFEIGRKQLLFCEKIANVVVENLIADERETIMKH